MNKLKKRPAPSKNEPRITSLEIAKLSGKRHDNVLSSIRKQEEAWEKVHKLKFKFMYKIKELPNGGKRKEPYYELTKMESLYIISKYNDEVRAKLVRRWYELENNTLLHELKPRKTSKGVVRLPYNEDEKDVLSWIKDHLIYGDYDKIAENTGYSVPSVSLVLNRKHVNELIVKEAYRVAIDNKIQGKDDATSVYSPAFISDAMQTIKKLEA